MAFRLVLILLVAFFLLAFSSHPLAVGLSIFLFIIVIGFCLFKVGIDLAIHLKKRHEDKDAYSDVFGESDVRTFYDIKRYSRARRAKYYTRKRRRARVG